MFGLLGDGREDHSHNIIPTMSGYRELESSVKNVVANGYKDRISEDSDQIRQLAMLHGVTPEDYKKYYL